MGTPNGYIVHFLESASLKKRKRKSVSSDKKKKKKLLKYLKCGIVIYMMKLI